MIQHLLMAVYLIADFFRRNGDRERHAYKEMRLRAGTTSYDEIIAGEATVRRQ